MNSKLISDKTSSLIVPPPECFHDRYDPNLYNRIDSTADISSPSPSTSTITNTDPLHLLCNFKHNHTISVSNKLLISLSLIMIINSL